MSESPFTPVAESFNSGPDTSVVGITSKALKLDLQAGTRLTTTVHQSAKVSGAQQRRC